MKMTIFFLSLFSSFAFAAAPTKVIVGAVANNNLIQGKIIESNSSLDIAIAGHGFLPLKNTKGDIFYTRFGSLGMDKDGDLQHILSGFKVVIPDEAGRFNTVSLETMATQPYAGKPGQLTKMIAMAFGDDGGLDVFYSDGQTVRAATLKLAAFENQRKLKVFNEKNYLLRATKKSGVVAYLNPSDHPVGKIYGHHLESISMTEYKKALQ